jgi:hypothetical protein
MDQHIKDWCYAECERQHATTPADIKGMEQAWRIALAFDRLSHPVNVEAIKSLAYQIDPVANPGGRFRTGPAVFMDGGTAANPQDIERYLSELFTTENMHFDLSPAEFYKELMWIHPWKDGNGRVGALVYNWLNGTLDNPVTPPPYK